MSTEEERLLDTFLVEGITYWLGLTDLAHEGESLNSFFYLIDFERENIFAFLYEFLNDFIEQFYD